LTLNFQVVDARDPLYYYSYDLARYVQVSKLFIIKKKLILRKQLIKLSLFNLLLHVMKQSTIAVISMFFPNFN